MVSRSPLRMNYSTCCCTSKSCFHANQKKTAIVNVLYVCWLLSNMQYIGQICPHFVTERPAGAREQAINLRRTQKWSYTQSLVQVHVVSTAVCGPCQGHIYFMERWNSYVNMYQRQPQSLTLYTRPVSRIRFMHMHLLYIFATDGLAGNFSTTRLVFDIADEGVSCRLGVEQWGNQSRGVSSPIVGHLAPPLAAPIGSQNFMSTCMKLPCIIVLTSVLPVASPPPRFPF